MTLDDFPRVKTSGRGRVAHLLKTASDRRALCGDLAHIAYPAGPSLGGCGRCFAAARAFLDDKEGA